ncbi:MAG TPA: ABC transporter permease [Rubrivivax sp.]|nr:ABC transporter permease [Rubrivivax sp.]
MNCRTRAPFGKTLLQLAAALPVWGGLCWPAIATAQDTQCGNPFRNHFGPYDYRSASADTKALVENVHFTPGVEAMTKPSTTTYARMAGDVAYTLHVFPNHHRALLTMQRLGEKFKTAQPDGAAFPVECYFERAVLFRPDDTVARALYAQYLLKHGRKEHALKQLAYAVEQAKDRPLSHYNLGLVYLEMGEYELALTQAHAAKSLGLDNRPQLEEALRKAGKWRDTPP